MIKKQIVKVLNKLPYIKGLKKDLDKYERWGLPGHFYNPIPDIEEVKALSDNLFKEPKDDKEIGGINFSYKNQLEVLHDLKKYYNEIPFKVDKSNELRYFFNNPNYSYSDAIFLYSIIRKYSPKRIIEIGSGFSSCVTLDTNEIFFSNKIECTFIEPYPKLLISLLKPNDKKNIKIIDNKIQNVNLEIFKKLEENDILFIDSSHVLKTGSDLQFILFKIIPILKKGVLIHFHDIFYPFEYPKDWIFKHNRAWNELYMLHSFLMYNNDFSIVAFSNYIINKNKQWFEENMPLCLKNIGGNIWLQKDT